MPTSPNAITPISDQQLHHLFETRGLNLDSTGMDRLRKQFSEYEQELHQWLHVREVYQKGETDIDIDNFLNEIRALTRVRSVTAMFINWDQESGKPYGQYRIPQAIKRKNLTDEADFLEGYRQYLDDPAHLANSSIPKIFHNYYWDLRNRERAFQAFEQPFTIESPLFQPVSLKGYSGDLINKIPKPGTSDMAKADHSVENFRLAENIMVKVMMKDFNPETTFFLPLPIISRGYLMGLLYFVFDEAHKDTRFLRNKESFIPLIARIYEDRILVQKAAAYGVRPIDPLAYYQEVVENLKEDYHISYNYPKTYRPYEFEPIVTANPFLMDLGFDRFYEDLAPVVRDRVIPFWKAYRANLRSAVSSIIVDSFAHNVGAHSLVALKWFFERRHKALDQSFKVDTNILGPFIAEAIEIRKTELRRYARNNDFHRLFEDVARGANEHHFFSLIDLMRWMSRNMQEELLAFNYERRLTGAKTVKEKVFFPFPIDQAIYRYFEYLRDKSAFWSGVTRDFTFSGMSMSWTDILKKFLNPLFLGSIAHSEGINRINFHVEVLEESEGMDQACIKASGEFARVNLDIMQSKNGLHGKGPQDKEVVADGQKDKAREYSDYAFLREGKDYEALIKVLEELEEVYLPNGVIGQQSLLTLFENTLRNIKHYRDFLEGEGGIRETGINLYFSIQPVKFVKRNSKETTEFKLFKVGAWLHHEQFLLRAASLDEAGVKVFEVKEGIQCLWSQKWNKDQLRHWLLDQETKAWKRLPDNWKSQMENNEIVLYKSILDEHRNQLHKRILTESGGAILGGSSQDRVCAAMLLNNRFDSIDALFDAEAKKHYFPYVFPATEPYLQPHERHPGELVDDQFFHILYNKALRDQTRPGRHEKYRRAVAEYALSLLRNSPKSKGVFKKYFHLWKAKNSKVITKSIGKEDDNPSRMKVVIVNEDNYNSSLNAEHFRSPQEFEAYDQKKPFEKARYELRHEGVVRIIEASSRLTACKENIKRISDNIRHAKGDGIRAQRKAMNEAENQQYAFAMANWLGQLLIPGQEQLTLSIEKRLKKGTQKIAHIVLSQVGDDFDVVHLKGAFSGKPDYILTINHGSSAQESQDEVCLVRNHGAYVKDIFRKENLVAVEKEVLPPIYAAKLMEAICTKIAIFDDRVDNHLRQKRDEQGVLQGKNVFHDQLHLDIFPEKITHFQEQIKDLLKNKGIHFLLIHLSFLENIPRIDRPFIKYKETEVKLFFEQEILPHLDGRKNFMLVIASGRGRNDWLEEAHHEQITFLPIEAIMGALEDGISMRDNFQVKYNLVQQLFGS